MLYPKTFPLLKVELPFDKNGIQSVERLFAMCSKSRSGAKSIRSKMIVWHLSNGRYKIPASRTRSYYTMCFDENFYVFLRLILIRRPVESSRSIIQICYAAGRLCYEHPLCRHARIYKKRAECASRSRSLINIDSNHARRFAREQMEIFKC